MTEAKLTIEKVEQRFKRWRLKKKTRERIPTYLWDAVEELTAHYALSTITKCLNLSNRQMKRKGLYQLPNVQPKEKLPSFVNIKLSPQFSIPPQLVIRRIDGTQLSYANLSDAQFILSIKTFINPGCE